MLPKGFQTLPILGIYGAMSRDNHKIESLEKSLIDSETLPNQTLDPVSVHRGTTTLFRDSQTNSPIAKLIRFPKYQKQPVRRALPTIKNPTIVVGLEQSATTGKSPFGCCQGAYI